MFVLVCMKSDVLSVQVLVTGSSSKLSNYKHQDMCPGMFVYQDTFSIASDNP